MDANVDSDKITEREIDSLFSCVDTGAAHHSQPHSPVGAPVPDRWLQPGRRNTYGPVGGDLCCGDLCCVAYGLSRREEPPHLLGGVPLVPELAQGMRTCLLPPSLKPPQLYHRRPYLRPQCFPEIVLPPIQPSEKRHRNGCLRANKRAGTDPCPLDAHHPEPEPQEPEGGEPELPADDTPAMLAIFPCLAVAIQRYMTYVTGVTVQG